MENEIESLNSKDIRPIMVSEAYFLLETQKERIVSNELNVESEYRKNFISTLEYAEMYSKIKSKSQIQDLRLSLNEMKLTEIEIGLVGSLLPQSPDEAKVLIPSLNRLKDDILELIIKKIQQLS